MERVLQEGRRRERAQARFYRRLCGAAEEAGDAAASERLNALLADEQHHVSRITARLLELGVVPDDDVPDREVEREPDLATWEVVARERESAEVEWYRKAVEETADRATRDVLEDILVSEEHHRDELSGKWMSAAGRSEYRKEDR
ncbi:MAG: hypothetical protein OEZ65_01125 [Gemmatimonadota bacterium]|nr:hypothetical protein [Gemmatimonadota bacterium]